MTTTRMDWRKVAWALLDLVPGDPSYVNGVSVTRVPCAGYWFRVASSQVDACDWIDQMLSISDALSRCAGGHVDVLKSPPGMHARYAAIDEARRLAAWESDR